MSPKALRTRWGVIVALWAGGMAAPALVYGQTKPVELDVPFVATHMQAVDAMLELAKVTSSDYVFDLGCGDGRIVVAAAKNYKARGFGVDLDPQRIRESNQNATKAGVTERVEFKLADIMVTDVRKATVVALFLLDSVNLRLRPRLLAQLKPGARVVSNTFHMADWKPDKTIRHGKAYDRVIHLWVVPAPVGGTWRWRTKTPGAATVNRLKLEQQFQAVTGAVRFPASGHVPIADVSLTGNQIRFTATPRMAGREVKIAYEGTVEGDTIRGTQEWLTGPSAGSYLWTAARDRLNITGRWQIRAPEHADHKGMLRIQRKESGFLATYVRDGQPKKDLSLPAFYVWGSSIRFEVPLGEESVVFTGSLTAEAGGGTVSRGSEGRKSQWTAKRVAGE